MTSIIVYMRERAGSMASEKKNFIIKLIVCVNFVLFLVLLVGAMISDARDDAERESFGYRVESLEDDYYRGDYAWLREMLEYYDSEYDDMDDEAFDVYREAVKAYEDYAAWRSWYGSLGTELDVEAQEKEAQYREAVYENAKNCQDTHNQKILNNLVKDMEARMALESGEKL